MSIKDIIYCCKICGGKICRDSALYGEGNCKSCSNKHKINIFPDRSGSNSPNWHGGWRNKLPKCKDCDNQVYGFYSERCQKCSSKRVYNIYLRNLKGESNPNYGKKRPDHSKRMLGENNPNWQNGISKSPYPFEFTNDLKQKIRKRDNFTCQGCGLKEEEHKQMFDRILSVHHIDYNKENCSEDNLITVCNMCNSKANGHRDYWFAFYTYKMEEIKWL